MLMYKKSCNLDQLNTTNLFSSYFFISKGSLIHARKGIQINICKCVKKIRNLTLKFTTQNTRTTVSLDKITMIR